MTKEAIRLKVWKRIADEGIARFPGEQGSIPNFLRSENAALALCSLTIWKRARAITIDSSAPLLQVRRAALEQAKVVYMARPNLRAERCFLELDPRRLAGRTTRAANLRGAGRIGRPVSPAEMRPVDLIVVGSVAVTRQGARVGCGGGAVDLQYGLLRYATRVREYTPIMTTVHPVQIIEDRIPMQAHDIPVDFVITPDQVVAAPSLYQRPRGILWDLLSEDRIRTIPALRKGRPTQRTAPDPRQR